MVPAGPCRAALLVTNLGRASVVAAAGRLDQRRGVDDDLLLHNEAPRRRRRTREAINRRRRAPVVGRGAGRRRQRRHRQRCGAAAAFRDPIPGEDLVRERCIGGDFDGIGRNRGRRANGVGDGQRHRLVLEPVRRSAGRADDARRCEAHGRGVGVARAGRTGQNHGCQKYGRTLQFLHRLPDRCGEGLW